MNSKYVNMITVPQAIKILSDQGIMPKTKSLMIADCLHLVSAAPIIAPVDVPGFDNSAMDGYVFCFEDYKSNQPLVIRNEIQAGTHSLHPLQKGEATRIFTGAPIPPNGDTVVPQELVSISNGEMHIQKEIAKYANIRPRGTQTSKGSLVLEKNTFLTAEYLGFLATLGISEILVYAPPRVGIINTGKELVAAGQPLQPFQIYESNGTFLSLALKSMGITPLFCSWIDDEHDVLKALVQQRLPDVDILLFTGGISVGDYDFVKPVLEELGALQHFFKVKQKPGKPLYFGKLENKAIFALPGNPSAVVACFHAYLKPYLWAAMGKPDVDKNLSGILINSYKKNSGLTHFVKARVEHNMVEILPNQLSYQMDAYSKANAFAVLPEDQEQFFSGEKVELIYFNQP